MKALYPADKYKLRNTTIHFANGMTLWVAGAYNKQPATSFHPLADW